MMKAKCPNEPKSEGCIFTSFANIKLTIVILLTLGFEVSDSLAQSCPSINFTLTNFNTCCYTVQLDNTSECTPQITLLLDFGQFTNWTVDMANGFTGTLINANEILLTHSSGIIPFGVSSPIEFCTENADPLEITMLYDFVCGPGESCFAEFPITTCSSQDTCTVNFEYTIESNCGLFQFLGIATGTSPITYLWDFGDPASGFANTSTLQNPTHQFSELCENYTICLSITTADDCTTSLCNEIVVLELESPVITCPSDILLKCTDDTSPDVTGFATAVDNCEPNPQITYSDEEVGSFPCDYEIIRTWLVVDQCGHESTCEQIITVMDNVPPRALCGLGKGYELDADCSFTVTPQLINGGSFDNCLIQSMSVTPSVVTGCGIFPVTLTVIDECGNTSSCSTEIQTIEVIPPHIDCPPDVTIMGELVTGGFCAGIVQIPPPTVSDNCDQPVTYINDYNLSSNASDVYPAGITIVTWTATDGCGNTATCEMRVHVIKCPPQTSDTSCCAYTLHFYNAYADQRIKKVRVSAVCDTRICCSDPDYWAENAKFPYYVEFFPADGSGFPVEPDPLDVIDNDFEIWLDSSVPLHVLQIDWYDFTDNIVYTNTIEISCDGDFDEDEDWTLYTTPPRTSNPNLFVFAVREPDDDGDNPCLPGEREKSLECAISSTITCCGNDYCVKLTGPAEYDIWTWTVTKQDASSTYVAPVISSNQNMATFQVPNNGNDSGRFIVAVTGIDTSGGTYCEAEHEIVIPNIIPDFTYELLPCGLSVKITPEISNFNSFVASISWTVPNDPSFPPSGTAPFIHAFPNEQIFNVTMSITDIFGCIHVVSKPVNNSRICTPDFAIEYSFCDDQCSGGVPQDILVTFKNKSTGGSCPVKYEWNFGDNSTGTSSSSSPDITHVYHNIPCPQGLSGISVTLTMDDSQTIPLTNARCATGQSNQRSIEISPCQADFTYKNCPDGSVIFTGTVPGIWNFPGSTSIDEIGSDPKDAKGLRRRVKVQYSNAQFYLVEFTGYCPNGGICLVRKEIEVNIECCTKNDIERDVHRFREPDPGGTRYKMKYKFSQIQILGFHYVKAQTSLKRRNSKWYNFWKNTRQGTLTAGFTGNIFKADTDCKCYVAETITGSNPGPHSNLYRVKTKEGKLGKFHSRINSLMSSHTVTLGSHTFTDHLFLGNSCLPFTW